MPRFQRFSNPDYFIVRPTFLAMLLVFALCRMIAAAKSPTVAEAPDFFDANHIVQIQITLPPADWERLRNQERSIKAEFAKERLEHAVPRPYTWFKADITVDGKPIKSVAIRKRGFFGSNDHDRPALNIELDRFTPGQQFEGRHELKLHNNKQDPGQARQALSYEFFTKAGVPAPRCNFAHVFVNGKNLGVYSNLEPMDASFLKRTFGNSDGNLYEATISDFQPGAVHTFEKKNNRKTGREDLDAVVQALQQDDDHLLESLGKILDIDAFINFWAVESLIGHWDGFTGDQNNCFIYHDSKTDKLRFIAWGADSTFGPKHIFAPFIPPASVQAFSILPRRLYNHPITQAKYRKRLREILDSAWDEKELLDEINRMSKLVRPQVTVSPIEMVMLQQQMRKFIEDRRGDISAELNRPAQPWNYPNRLELYAQKVGSMSMTFSTKWTPAYSVAAAGATGHLDLEFYGRSYSADFPGVKAIPSPNEPSKAAVLFSGAFANVEPPIFVLINMRREKFVPGDLKVDGTQTFVAALAGDFIKQDFRVIGTGNEGVIHLTSAGTNPGDNVSGTAQIDLYELRWDDFDLTKLRFHNAP